MQTSPGHALAAVARRQHGAFTRRQALAAGFTASTLTRRVDAGQFRVLRRGVYGVAGAPDTWEVRALAAQLGLGGGAVLARTSAARVLALPLPDPNTPLELLLHGRAVPPGAGDLRVHRTTHLDDEDVVRRGALRLTSPARTAADLAGDLDTEDLRRLVAGGVRDRILTGGALRAAIARLGTFRGRRSLRAVVDELSPLTADCRSALEGEFLHRTTSAGLAPTVMNHPVRDAFGRRRLIDAAWLPERLPVELDSELAHGSSLDRIDDVRRENALVLTGWLPFLRFTWHDVTRRPDEMLALIRTALGRPT